MGPAAHQEADQDKEEPEPDASPSEGFEPADGRVQGELGIEDLAADRLRDQKPGDHAAHELGDGRRQEPDRHHEGHHPGQGELGDLRQADGRQEEFPRGVQEVEQAKQDQGHPEGAVVQAGTPDHDQEAQADLDQAETELQGRVRILPATSQPGPQGGKKGREDQDKAGVERLGLGGADRGVDPAPPARRPHADGGQLVGRAEGDAKEVAPRLGEGQVHICRGEEVERGARLLEEGEEDHRPQHQDGGQSHPLALHRGLADPDDDPGQGCNGQDDGCNQRHSDQPAVLNRQEDDADGQDRHDVGHPLPVDEAGEGLVQHLGVGRLALALEKGLAEHEDHPAHEHAHPGQAKASPPAEVLSEEAAKDGGPEGTEIDAVIVEGEAGVPAGIAMRVEVAHHSGDVGLEEAHPEDDQRNGEIEHAGRARVLEGPDLELSVRDRGAQAGLDGNPRNGDPAALARSELVLLALHQDVGDAVVHPALGDDRKDPPAIDQVLPCAGPLKAHGDVTRHQQKRTEGDGLARAQPAVGNESAEKRQKIDQGRVGRIHRAGLGAVEHQVLGQVEDQYAPHAVVGEPLPHLGEKQDNQALRVVPHQLDQHGHARGEGDEQAEEDDDVHLRGFRLRAGAMAPSKRRANRTCAAGSGKQAAGGQKASSSQTGATRPPQGPWKRSSRRSARVRPLSAISARGAR